MDAQAYFAGKKITVMGLGLLGRGVGDVAYLAACGAKLIVTDIKTREELAPSLEKLAHLTDVQFVLGEHRLQDFRDRDLILKGAGVPLHSMYIDEARRHGIPVRMSADLFAELSGATIIGITGTRGKTTTTYLIYEIVRRAGFPVLLGGNIYGVSTLAMLPQASSKTIAVLELDSWQLQGFQEIRTSPTISVFTSFYPDHCKYYRGDLQRYFSDKSVCYAYQNKGDVLVVGTQVAPYIQAVAPEVASRAIVANTQEMSGWTRILKGAHNIENCACAVAVARSLGVSDTLSQEVIGSFTALSGRLQHVFERDAISIYNDAFAIIPEATLAALRALEPSPVILICGGGDKGSQLDEFLAYVTTSVKRTFLLTGSGTDRIRSSLPQASLHDTLRGALAEARQAAEPGDIILFSPGFSSRGMFRDANDRNEQFLRLVQSL